LDPHCISIKCFSWTVPEEFRVWKERVDAIEKKKLLALQPPAQHSLQPPPAIFTAPVAASPLAAVEVREEVPAQAPAVVAPAGGRRKKGDEDDEEKPKPVAPVYANQEERVTAFKDLLTEKRVLVTSKMKEVIELCSEDVRFSALKTGGEKKQALAEYQVRYRCSNYE
jgi:hypothetical protein